MDPRNIVDRRCIFGDYLRKAREKKKISLTLLARVVGCSIPYLSDVENGRRNPLTEKNLLKVSEHLSLNLDTLRLKAAISLGQFKLPVTTDRADRLAIRLAKTWTNLGERELQAIEEVIENITA